ncbi:saccharopine dehydrogenase family protein [Sphingomonas sp.]|uniref:saccharopine dehydrogenase family protein n=1 Tax=Sphingomonas sp. TaxID=28214 RepID=UPI003B3BCF08
MNERSIDIAVFGATGFTGSLVLQYLIKYYGDQLRLAAVGRNAEKLQRLREAVGGEKVAALTADAADPASLRKLARSAHVIVSTVGPYHAQGSPLVQACAEAGTDYCDLSAEPDWILGMIHEQGACAERTGARLLFSCGFDSVPSEIGVMAMQRQAMSRFNMPLRHIGYRYPAEPPPLSGGTLASLRGNLERAHNNRQVAALLANPFSLTPGFRGPVIDCNPVTYDPVIKEWTAPFMMSFINVPNVHRTAALLGHPWGRDFIYDERIRAGNGPAGRMLAEAIAKMPSLLELQDMPAPGEGPDAATRDAGSWTILFYGETAGADRMRMMMHGVGDPGYGSTSKMLAETAICLRYMARKRGGALTAGAALGQHLEARLVAHAGVTILFD